MRNTVQSMDLKERSSFPADRQRAKMTITQSGTTVLTRLYGSHNYMKETAGRVIKEYTYLGGNAYSTPVVAVTQSGTTTYYYLLRDYLCNITHQVNTLNTVVAEYNFDVWGRRRNPTDWSYTLTSQPALFADRGFTSHEFLSWFNLYNMNGRLYDPLAGRFLSADNYIQDPTNTQCYNRYSYGLNNPLKYSDPSGMRLVPDNPAIDAYFRALETADMNFTNSGDGSGGGWGGGDPFAEGPGYGKNGTGLNGTYYDWYSGTYRSTAKGNPEIGWNSVFQNIVGPNTDRILSGSQTGDVMRNVGEHGGVSSLVFSGSHSNQYETFRGFLFSDGSSFYFDDVPAGQEGGILDKGLEYTGRTNDLIKATGDVLATNGLTSAMVNSGKAIKSVAGPAGYAIGIAQIGLAYRMDGYQIGYNTEKAGAGFFVGMAGAWAGLQAGSWAGFEGGFAVGLYFDGIGAIPGAVIGGIGGGIVGAFGGAYGGNILGESLISNKAQ